MAIALAAPTAEALQMTLADSKRESTMNLVMLDENECNSRGSHCLDGSTPGYYYKQGTEENKWVFWLQGGGLCTDEADCADMLPLNDPQGTMDSLPLQNYGEFANYNHVYVTSCDRGLWLGDRSEPVSYNGKKLYFQGKRVLEHIFDSLQTNASFGSATEVLLSGGSGGGQGSYVLADYVKSIMPSSVHKFGAVPMNGWYVEGGLDGLGEVKDLFTLANMKNAISPSCDAAMGEERYKCIDPATSYRYSTSNIFATQVFDYTFQWNSTDEVTSAYNSCLSEESSAGQCDDDSVNLLQGYLDNFTQILQAMPKYNEHGQGGFVSTCTVHVFYNEEDLFGKYSTDGVKVGDAIEQWWTSLGTNPPAAWYMPCTLGNAQHAQCESTCS